MAQSSDIKYFESGFLVVSTGGTSATGGTGILGLQSISLNYTVDVEELTLFDNNFTKIYSPTYKSWTASASGVFLSLTSENTHPQSGDTKFIGATNASLLLEQIKQRSTNTKVFFKIDSENYQSGTCILTSFELSADAGSPMTFSIELTGTSDLTKSTS